ncbi:MAG: nuclear transport factor 2 family protein [Ekhidna sp.]|uniref:nuclear transport factor 2 family protein n=1 Tax=Ekhidna sp. TaxID=2608089 RepID=UPI0032EB88BC
MKYYIFLLLPYFLNAVAFGQSNEEIRSGIYLNVQAYENDQLTYEIDCSSEKHKIKPNTHKKRGSFRVVHNKQKIDLNKEEVYGYRDCKGRDFRFENNVSYEIIFIGHLILYSNYVDDGLDENGNMRRKKVYFFSKLLSSDIIPLSVENLKNAYPNNHKFHDLIDTNFSSGSITAYDDFHDTYKVNRYLALSREDIATPKEGIDELIQRIQDAINAKDLHSLNNCFSDKTKVYEQGSIDDSWEHYRDGHLGKEIEEMEDMSFLIEVDESLTTKQMALVRGKYFIRGKMHGREINSSGLITLSMRVEQDMWKVIHLQFSRGCK